MDKEIIKEYAQDGTAIRSLLDSCQFIKIKDAKEFLDLTITDLTSPLQLMMMGEFSTGKSTFINALLGEAVTVVGALPTTAVITKLVYADAACVVAHFIDDTEETFDAEEFSRLTAETAPGGKNFRDRICYVEYGVPAKVLRDVNIIDSPGLGAIKEAHTKTTKAFVHHADVVFWMFDASCAVKASEMDAMAELDPRLKPVAILNKMDMLDDEEEAPEEFVREVTQRLKGKVRDVLPISAKTAYEGKVKGDERLLSESGIVAVERMITDTIVPHSASYKIDAYMERIALLLLSIHGKLDIYKNIARYTQEEDAYVQARENLDRFNLWMNQYTNRITAYAEKEYASGNVSATLFLAITYLTGIGRFTSDEEKGITALRQSAEQNSLIGQILLASRLVEAGDYEAAEMWAARILERDADSADLLEMQGLGQFILGHLAIQHGDRQQGIELYRAAMEKGSTEAANDLGMIYQHGEGVATDYAEALRCYRYAAERDEPVAQYNLGHMHYYGFGTPEDHAEAIRWIRLAAEGNHPTAQIDLAVFLCKGECGLAKNPEEALKWLQCAANQGSEDAQEHLALFYSGAYGEVIPDYAKAADILERLFATQDEPDPCVMEHLGQLYLMGEHGLTKDVERGLYWLERAADKGDDDARKDLMWLYANGDEDILPDRVKAAQIAEQLLEENPERPKIVEALGYMYVSGEGLPRDTQRGLKWLTYGDAQGYANVKEMLMRVYYNGTEEIPPDYTKAVRLAKELLSEQQEQKLDVMNALGYMYLEGGYGITRDLNRARIWLEKAMAAGSEEAPASLAALYWNESYSLKQDYAKATQILEKLFKRQENPEPALMRTLGVLYLEGGHGITANPTLAQKWLKRAAEGGDADAKNVLANINSNNSSGCLVWFVFPFGISTAVLYYLFA